MDDNCEAYSLNTSHTNFSRCSRFENLDPDNDLYVTKPEFIFWTNKMFAEF